MRLHISTLVVVITSAAALGVLLGQPCAGASLSHEVLEYLRNRIETAGVPPRIAVGEEMIYSSVALPRFYERRTYQPAWIDDHGPLPRVSSLIQSIKRAEREGLKPVDYHLNKIEAIFGEVLENQNKKIRLNPAGWSIWTCCLLMPS